MADRIGDFVEGLKTRVLPIQLRLEKFGIDKLSENLAKGILKIKDAPQVEDDGLYVAKRPEYRVMPDFVVSTGNVHLSPDFYLVGTNPNEDELKKRLQLNLSKGFVVRQRNLGDQEIRVELNVNDELAVPDLKYSLMARSNPITAGEVTRREIMRADSLKNKPKELAELKEVILAAAEVTRKYRPSTRLYKDGQIVIVGKDNKDTVRTVAKFDRTGKLELTFYETEVQSRSNRNGFSLERGKDRNKDNELGEYMKENEDFSKVYIKSSDTRYVARNATLEEKNAFLKMLFHSKVDAEKTTQEMQKVQKKNGFFGSDPERAVIDWVKDISSLNE